MDAPAFVKVGLWLVILGIGAAAIALFTYIVRWFREPYTIF
jgi:hypothetical protein